MKKIKIVLILLLSLFTISIQAKEENNNTHLHVVDYDHPISFEQIKSRYSSYDSLDGDITDQLQFQSEYEEDYTNNNLYVKSYPLLVSITNSRNHTTEWKDEISVRDFSSPKLFAKENEIKIDISQEDVNDALINTLEVSDNYDTTFKNYFFEGLADTPGTYSVRCSITDSSGNVSNEILLIVHLFETINKQIISTPILLENKVLPSSELLALFLQNNTIDTAYKSVDIRSSYFDNPQKEGIYLVEFKFDYGETIQIYQCKLINTVHEQKKKDELIIYISLGCILFLSIIGVVWYRKRL